MRFDASHVWVRAEPDGRWTLGLTSVAIRPLGVLTFLDIADAGTELRRGETGAVLEGPRAIRDVRMPCGGTVVAANLAVAERPALVNRDPYGAGWLLQVAAWSRDELDALMDEQAYRDWLGRSAEHRRSVDGSGAAGG